MRAFRLHIRPFAPVTRFRRDETGAILVEFGIVMPFMILMLAVIFESGRMLWSYQVTVAGVRDAARYLARIAPIDICLNGGNLNGYTTTLMDIVEKDASQNSLFPTYVSITSVTPSLTCVVGTYRVNPAPVGTVTANLTIEFPFSGIMSYFGGGLSTINATVSDQSRIFGQ